MIYSFTGAQSTGKTSLLNLLKQRNKNYTYVNEITRELLNNGYKINDSENDYNELQLLICASHINNLITNKDSILDRCIFDGYVYTKYFYENNKVSFNTYQIVKNYFYSFCDKYDRVFYTDPDDVALIDDGVRSTSTYFRNRIIDIYNELNIESFKNVTILSGTIEERYNQILKYI